MAGTNAEGTSSPKRILHVVSNVSHYADPNEPTGLWLSELTHAYDLFAEKGYHQDLVSPKGGKSPLEPRALKFPMVDGSAKAWLADESKMKALEETKKASEVKGSDYDVIYFTGGHAVCYDFPDDPELQRLARETWESGGIVSSVCHGYAGLLNVKLSDGSYLVADKKLTGFSWNEEIVAGVKKLVPFNVEEEMRKRGAKYEKNLIPFTCRVTTDGKLVTGQNPFSAKGTAQKVISML